MGGWVPTSSCPQPSGREGKLSSSLKTLSVPRKEGPTEEKPESPARSGGKGVPASTLVRTGCGRAAGQGWDPSTETHSQPARGTSAALSGHRLRPSPPLPPPHSVAVWGQCGRCGVEFLLFMGLPGKGHATRRLAEPDPAHPRAASHKGREQREHGARPSNGRKSTPAHPLRSSRMGPIAICRPVPRFLFPGTLTMGWSVILQHPPD